MPYSLEITAMSYRSTPRFSRSRQWITSAVVLATAALLAPGCGGGSSSGSGSGSSSGSGSVASGGLKTGIGGSGGIGNTGGSGSGSNGGGGTVVNSGGTAVTETQRAADITAIVNKMAALGGPANLATLPAYIKTLSGVRDSELETDGNITCAFTDGEWLVIYNNRAAGTPVDLEPYPAPGSKDAMPRTVSSQSTRVAKTRDLAVGTTARIIDYFGGGTIDGQLTTMFNTKGYANVLQTDASLKNILNTDNADATFLNTHGGTCRFIDPTDPGHLRTVKDFGVLTNTAAPYQYNGNTNSFSPLPGAARDPATDALIQQGLVGFGLAEGANTPCLAVRPTYLGQNWTFPSNSVLFCSVCESAPPATSTLQQAAFAGGAGAFLGYDETVLGTDASNDAGTIFEGLLGTHIFNTQNRGRAWNLSSFYSAMQAAGKTSHNETLPNGSVRVANLILSMGSGNFTGLCPGIQYMYVIDSMSQLVLVGDFGSQQGTVTVNGQTVSTTWTTSKITCNGISTDPGGPTFSGPVVVTYNGHDSNQVDLTQYVGDVHYEEDDQGTLIHTADLHLACHADVHFYRTNPFQSPTRPSTSMGAENSSTFKYNNTGSWTIDTATETINGSGTLPNGAYTGGLNQYVASFTLINSSNLAEFMFDFEAQNAYSTYENGQYAGMSELTPLAGIYTHTSPNYIGMTMDASLNIQAYNGPHNTVSAGGYSETSFLNANLTATPTPDNTKQEDSSSD